MQGLSRDNAFWQFSLRVYAQRGVADECLALQDQLGLDVNVLLFCAWLAIDRGIALTSADVETIKAEVRAWHDDVVRPLRHVRRHLKPIAEQRAQELHAQVKALELDAEQLEQARLFALAQKAWPARGVEGRDLATGNVQACLAAYGGKDLGASRLVDAAVE